MVRQSVKDGYPIKLQAICSGVKPEVKTDVGLGVTGSDVVVSVEGAGVTAVDPVVGADVGFGVTGSMVGASDEGSGVASVGTDVGFGVTGIEVGVSVDGGLTGVDKKLGESLLSSLMRVGGGVSSGGTKVVAAVAPDPTVLVRNNETTIATATTAHEKTLRSRIDRRLSR